MVTNANQGYRSLSAPGLSSDAAAQSALAVLRARPGLAVHELAPGRISVSRNRRPPWAIVACILTLPLALLGLLFLLVKRTESGELVVADGPRGCVVTVPPILDAAAVAALEAALAGPGAAPGGPPSMDPVVPPPPPAPAAGDLGERTVARRDLPAATVTVAPRLDLRFAAGTVTVAAGLPIVLGRDPSPPDDAEGVSVPGDASTVSKSHLRVSFDGVTTTVEDLGSTNGSRLVRPGGEVPLAPGAPCPVADGDRVLLGTVAFVIDQVPGTAP
jgi:hypothetical protein